MVILEGRFQIMGAARMVCATTSDVVHWISLQPVALSMPQCKLCRCAGLARVGRLGIDCLAHKSKFGRHIWTKQVKLRRTGRGSGRRLTLSHYPCGAAVGWLWQTVALSV